MPEPTQTPPPGIGHLVMSTHKRTFHIAMWGWQSHPKHPQGGYEIDEAFADALIHAHSTMARDEFYPSIMRVHDDEEGYTYGLVIAVRKTPKGIEADVLFADGYEEKFDKGLLDGWSPTWAFGFKHPTSGEVFEVFLSELSFVSKRQFKNLAGASPHYRNSEQPLAHQEEAVVADENTEPEVENEEPETEEEVENMEPDLGAKIDTLTDSVNALVDALAPKGEPVESEEVENQEARIAALELANAELRVRNTVPGLKEAEVKQIAALSISNAEAATMMLNLAKQAQSKPATKPVVIPNSEVGGAAPASTPTSKTPAQVLLEKCQADKLSASKYASLARKQGLELTNAEVSQAKLVL